jgi:hypothetical protein
MNSLLLMALFSVASLGSAAFLVRQYRRATPAQRRQIVWAAGGSLGVAVLMLLMARV